MATIKLYLDKRAVKKMDEPAPVKISLCFRGKTALYSTGVRVLPEQWDAEKEKIMRHPQRVSMSAMLMAMRNRWEMALLELSSSGRAKRAKTATELRGMILKALCPEEGEEVKGGFLAHFTRFAASRRTAGNREAYQRTIRRMEAFDGALGERTFEDINKQWLEAFEAFMTQTAPSANARAFHLRNIRAVFNDAIDEEVTTAYPFRKFKIRKTPTPKRALTVEQLRQLFGFPCERYQEAYRDMFMLMFFLIGITGLTCLRPGRMRLWMGAWSMCAPRRISRIRLRLSRRRRCCLTDIGGRSIWCGFRMCIRTTGIICTAWVRL